MASWTKRKIVLQALEEIGIASNTFDSTASQLQSAMHQLDAMMGEWIAGGVVFTPTAYPISADPTVASLDSDTNAPAGALAAMYLNLALRIAPSYGKLVSKRTVTNAKKAYSSLLSSYVGSTEYTIDPFLKGAGAKRPFYAWTEPPVETV